jgi:hypothetical protein
MRNAWRHHASPVRFLSAPYHYRASRPNGGAQLHIFAAIASHRPRGSAIQCHRAQRRPRRRCHRQNRQRRHREFRKIRISVIGRPDLKVQTRDGYYAMQDNQALDPKREFQELTGSLLTPIPFNGIPIPTSYTELVTSPAPHLTVRFVVSSTSLSWAPDAKGAAQCPDHRRRSGQGQTWQARRLATQRASRLHRLIARWRRSIASNSDQRQFRDAVSRLRSSALHCARRCQRTCRLV